MSFTVASCRVQSFGLPLRWTECRENTRCEQKERPCRSATTAPHCSFTDQTYWRFGNTYRIANTRTTSCSSGNGSRGRRRVRQKSFITWEMDPSLKSGRKESGVVAEREYNTGKPQVSWQEAPPDVRHCVNIFENRKIPRALVELICFLLLNTSGPD